MSPLLLFWTTLAAALGCGLVAGIFLAFSSFVMQALARIPPPAGIAAMQSINIVVLNPLFLPLFLGTGLLCLGLLAFSIFHWRSQPAAAWWAVGAVWYLVGTIGVTMTCNVPRNDALAKIDPAPPASVEVWQRYVQEWTRWNHVRTGAALAAAMCLTIALVRLPGE